MQELLTIPLMYNQAFEAAESKLERMGMTAGTIAADDSSPMAKSMMDKYGNAEKEATASLADGVYNRSVFELTRNAVNSYRENVLPVAAASNKLEQFRQRALQAGIPIHRNVNLDTFLNSNEQVDIVDGVRVQTSASAAMKAESQFHKSSGWTIEYVGGLPFIKTFDNSGIPLADRKKTINGVEPDYIARARENIRGVYNYYNKTKEEQVAIDDNITRGFLDGMLYDTKQSMQQINIPRPTGPYNGRRGGGGGDNTGIPSKNINYCYVDSPIDNYELRDKISDAFRDGKITLKEEYRESIAIPWDKVKNQEYAQNRYVMLDSDYNTTNAKWRARYAVPLTNTDYIFEFKGGVLSGTTMQAADAKGERFKQSMVVSNTDDHATIKTKEAMQEKYLNRYAGANSFVGISKTNGDVNAMMFEYFKEPINSGNAIVYKKSEIDMDRNGVVPRSKQFIGATNSLSDNNKNTKRLLEILDDERGKVFLGVECGMPCIKHQGETYYIISSGMQTKYTNPYTGKTSMQSLGEVASFIYNNYLNQIEQNMDDPRVWNNTPYSSAYPDVRTAYISQITAELNKIIDNMIKDNKLIDSSKPNHGTSAYGVDTIGQFDYGFDM